MNETGAALVAILGFVVAFPLIWTGVVYLISRVSGWTALAARFAVAPDRRPRGDTFGWQSVQLRLFASYSNCVDVVVSERGLFLQPVWPFRFGHAPLLIPWNDIADVSSQDRLFFTVNKVTIRPRTTGGSGQTLMLFGKRLGESLKRHAELRGRRR